MPTNNSIDLSYTKTIFSLTFIFTVFYLLFWFFMHMFLVDGPGLLPDLYSDTYGFIALLGSYSGYIAAKRWGGTKSFLGKSLLLFSTGLLFQFLGQVSFVYYRIVLGIENPYPSFGELFYFGSLPIYILGAFYLYKAVRHGSNTNFTLLNKILFTTIPIVMVSIAYYLFLVDYPFSEVSALVVFLDFGYPLLQALLFSLGLIIFLYTRSVLGGILKWPVITMLIAILLQYIADTVYAIRIINETWYGGDITDFLYILAYFTMALALYKFLSAYLKLKNLQQ